MMQGMGGQVQVRQEMEGIAKLDVPLVVDAATGVTWHEAKA